MNRTLSFRRLQPAPGAALVVLLMAGCGSAPTVGGKAADTASSSKPASTAATASPSTGASAGTPTSTPTPSARPLPRAADGKRYSTCRDGTCEVAISRPVRIAVKGGRLTVIKVKPNNSLKFDLTFTYGGGGGSGVLKGTCGTIATFYRYAGGAGMEGCRSEDSTPKKPARVKGALRMQLVGWDRDKAAVLRLVSG
ncbi:hypothetical protein ACIBI9_59120 [Nonomuraea sp. NPDC050451]|uniref:hypothetical protein n=1 Tax=Nonomuraea sp. NPDC050451 TaxID=3364364 RepID=UPI00379B9155